ncbi:PfkB family carbohydrate kinase [Microbacterium sp. NPDC028030]|uniref:1-phosphofructokinase family hexose kinase n=1 Tax=Microbacterium sp. NPDC028030 TaxID=3155124 RepID=UPI0033E04865
MKVVIASLNPAIERLLVVDENRPGTVHRLMRSETLAGGKGVNVARVLAQLHSPAFAPLDDGGHVEVSSVLVGPLGGPTGDLQATLLAAEGLVSETTSVDGWTRVNEILVDESRPDGATVYNAQGPTISPHESAELNDLAVSSLDGAAMLVCTGSLPPGIPDDFYATWIGAARERGIRTLLDAHGAALRLGAAAAPDIIKVNRDEIADLAADEGVDQAELIRGWRVRGTEAVIVTDGSEPLRAEIASTAWDIDAPTVATRSAVGSGDAFTAGLVWSILARPAASWPTHLALAVACGASNAASTLARLSDAVPPRSLVDQVRLRAVDPSRPRNGSAR